MREVKKPTFFIIINGYLEGEVMAFKKVVVDFDIVFEFIEGKDSKAEYSETVEFQDGQNKKELEAMLERKAKEIGKELRDTIVNNDFISVGNTFFRTNLIKSFTVNP